MLRCFRVVTLAALVFSLTPLCAQTSPAPKVEVFGGFSLLHTPPMSLYQKVNYSGWNGAVTVYVRPWFGLVTDVSGHYKSESFGTFDVNSNFYNASFGPQFKYRTSRLEPFAHAMFGYARKSDKNTSVPTITFPVSGISTVVGGGIDVRLSRRVAFRLAQADYVFNRYSGYNHNNFRFSSGVVFGF